jgi:hypothetical protein
MRYNHSIEIVSLNNDLQNNTKKTKDRVTRTPLKTGRKLRCTGCLYLKETDLSFNQNYII